MKHISIKGLRTKLELTQKEFSKIYGIDRDTIKSWEQGRRNPNGASLVLLNIIDKEPEKTAEILTQIAKEKGYASFGEYNCPNCHY